MLGKALLPTNSVQEVSMAGTFKPGWSRPSTILFASETLTHEKAFGFALAEAAEFGAELIIFHAYDSASLAASGNSRMRRDDYAQARSEELRCEHLAQRASELGIRCRIVVGRGAAADQILAFLHERKIDRVIMGTHSPGPIGKLLVGPVAEAVLRNADVPVAMVGPEVVEGTYRNAAARTILCSVDTHASSRVVAKFAAELAAKHHANLILQNVIPPQRHAEVLAGRTVKEVEAELPALIPKHLRHKVGVSTRVVLGDPTEEVLHHGRVLQANLIVLGAQGASHFAAVTRASMVYTVLAFAHCPVITLSPVVLAQCGGPEGNLRQTECCVAGAF
jgi:nucleotide-binding universal stress UspA family protein